MRDGGHVHGGEGHDAFAWQRGTAPEEVWRVQPPEVVGSARTRPLPRADQHAYGQLALVDLRARARVRPWDGGCPQWWS